VPSSEEVLKSGVVMSTQNHQHSDGAILFFARSLYSSVLPGWNFKRLQAGRILLQLRVFRLGRDEDGNVGVGVFPQREEILISRLGLGGVALHGVGAAETETR
jgi:hypothetical protein